MLFTNLLYLHARHYAPSLGIFPARDPFEGAASRAMSLNGYAWVEGNVVNAVDPSGEQSGCPTNATYLEPGSCGTMGTGPVTSRPLTFQNARPPSYSFNGGTSRPLDQAVVPSQPQTPRIGGTSPNTPFVRPLQPNPAIPRSQPFADPMGLANICNAGLCNPDALLDEAGVQGQSNTDEQRQEQLGSFSEESAGSFENAIARGETFVTDWAQIQNINNDNIKLLYRGTSLTGARRAVRAASGNITWNDLVAGTDQNKYWLASAIGAVLIYASINAAQRREGRGVILIYAIFRTQLQTLIATGHVTNRAGGPPPLDTGLEYGFDVFAMPSLFGPAVISQ